MIFMQIGTAYSTIDLQPMMMKYSGGHVGVSNPLVKLTYNKIPNPSFRIARVPSTGAVEM